MQTIYTSPSAKKGAKVLREFRNSLFNVSLKETNILSVDLTAIKYDKEEVMQIDENAQYLARNKNYLLLINSDPLSSITFEGLKIFASPAAFRFAKAKAYVIQTFSQRLMAHFYLRYFKPEIPTQFFRSKKEAEIWLLRSFRHAEVA